MAQFIYFVSFSIKSSLERGCFLFLTSIMSNKKSVNLEISLDDKRLPAKINWSASDSPMQDKECKAFLLALWDGEANNTLRIDLWTKDMKIQEMNYFFFQTLMTMSDTYQKATQNPEIANEIRKFSQHFAQLVQANEDKKKEV